MSQTETEQLNEALKGGFSSSRGQSLCFPEIGSVSGLTPLMYILVMSLFPSLTQNWALHVYLVMSLWFQLISTVGDVHSF